jgi:hypothetical protein
MRLNWAKEEAKRGPATPALTQFIKASSAECRILRADLANVNKLVRLEDLIADTRV